MKVDPKDFTVHGFRSTFRSWARDTGKNEVAAELALGYDLNSQTAKVYTRDARMTEIRQLMMDEWGGYCDRTDPLPSSIIPFRKQEIAS